MLKNIKYILFRIFLYLSLVYSLANYSWATTITHNLKVGDKNITVEIAQTENMRRKGLMHRTKLAKDQGMLFIFDDSDWHCFWMKNTLLPLSIAFIDEQNYIVDIQDMQAQSLASHCPARKINQALEMNQGWFQKNDIRIGDKIYFN